MTTKHVLAKIILAIQLCLLAILCQPVRNAWNNRQKDQNKKNKNIAPEKIRFPELPQKYTLRLNKKKKRQLFIAAMATHLGPNHHSTNRIFIRNTRKKRWTEKKIRLFIRTPFIRV